MADEQRAFTLDELALRTADAARAEIMSINHVEFLAGSNTVASAVVADIRRQAAALALCAQVMEHLKANPAMALGLDLNRLMMIDRELDGHAEGDQP